MNEKKPEYGEPWNGNGPLPNPHDFRFSFHLTSDSLNLAYNIGYHKAESRVIKLINLFAGVPDSVIEGLVSVTDAKQQLIMACLCQPLESVPLAMLIDEIQDTPEYQSQLGCYRTWKQMYDMLIDTAARLRESHSVTVTSDDDSYDMSVVMEHCTHDIFKFLAPLIESNKE